MKKVLPIVLTALFITYLFPHITYAKRTPEEREARRAERKAAREEIRAQKNQEEDSTSNFTHITTINISTDTTLNTTKNTTTSSTSNNTKAPTLTPTKSAQTSIQTLTNTTDDKKTYIMDAINEYRASQGLSSVKTDPYTCGFAKTRAQEISVNFNHDGFTERVNNHMLPYPSYSYITENIAMTSNYKDVVNMWANSPGHAANMRANTPYVCVESYGNFYAYEGWRP